VQLLHECNDRLQCLAEGSYENGLEFMENIRKWPANFKPEGCSVDGLWLQDYLPDTLLHNVSTHTCRMTCHMFMLADVFV